MSIDISIVIATRNRVASLQRQFTAFKKMDTTDLNYEIIIIDNGSTDGTSEWIKEMEAQLPVIPLFEGTPGKNRALNLALPAIRGSLVLFTDDDTIPVAHWLKAYHAAQARWPEHNIFSGVIDPLFPENAPKVLTNPSYPHASKAFGRYRPDHPEGITNQVPFGGNYAVRAEILSKYRFCETIGPSANRYPMGSETEILYRFRDMGEKFVFVPDAAVGHIISPHQLTRRWLKSRGFRYGWGVAQMQPDAESIRLFGAPRYLWRKAAYAWVQDFCFNIVRHPNRWNTCFSHQVINGTIYGHIIAR